MPINLKIAKADILVENGGTQEELLIALKEQILPALFKKLSS
jgi:hypothetical protein